MTSQSPMHRYRSAWMAFAMLLGAIVANHAFATDWGRAAEREDSRTCQRFGAEHGREYTRCMLEQQRRRDDAVLSASEQQRNNAEAARNNVETVRRIRCNREAERARKRGEQPQWCP